MLPEEQLAQKIQTLLMELSSKAVEEAKQTVKQEQFKYGRLREALDYYMQEVWYNAAHPSLLSLSCRAVGGNPDDMTRIGSAFVLLTGAADIHDDIIDQSLTKAGKPTVFGKYGRDIAIIAGNVLWIIGMDSFNQACGQFSSDKKEMILKLTKEAFFDIGCAEAWEANLKGNINVQPEEYLEVIKLKVSVGTASAKIGAIVGEGTPEQIEGIGEYARRLGILLTIREDFINMFEPDELTNRLKNECLPLPILYAFQEAELKERILAVLTKEEIAEVELIEMLDLIYNNCQVRKLGEHMHLLAKEAIENLQWVNNLELKELLEFSLQDLPK